MANRTWLGTAAVVAMVWKGTITTTTTGHTYVVTVTDEFGQSTAFSYALVAGDTTVTIAAASFVTAWNASNDGIISRFTASSSVGQIILTQDSGGIPFTMAATGTGTWSGTGNTTAPQSPNDYSLANNWSEGAVPVAGDNVFITGAVAITYGLNQSSVEVGDFIVVPGCTAAIGSSRGNLRIDVANSNVFDFSGTGLAYIDIGGSAISPRVRRTASPASQGSAGLFLKGTAFVTLNLDSGTVRLDPASTCATCNVGSSGTLLIPAGCTITTVNNLGGNITLGAACTTLINASGTTLTEGTGAITTLSVDDGTVTSNSSGTITAATCDGGTLDFLKSRTARTVTTLTMRGGACKLDSAVVTVTNAIVTVSGVEIKAAA